MTSNEESLNGHPSSAAACTNWFQRRSRAVRLPNMTKALSAYQMFGH